MKRVHLKKPSEIEKMRSAGRVVARVLAEVQAISVPGVTTLAMDELAASIIHGAGGQASFFRYRVGDRIFPAHICASVNDEVVHGIPCERELKEGDIVGVDVGVFMDGFHADSAATFAVGNVSPEASRLLKVTREALLAGIGEARAGVRVGRISAAIQRYAESRGYHLAKNLVGHGVGRHLHEDPQVPNYGSAHEGPRMEPGMTLAVEPMVNIGTREVVGLDDEWTIVTADGTLSAHFEHTIAITRQGVDILTLL